jgi:hypothetical protein
MAWSAAMMTLPMDLGRRRAGAFEEGIRPADAEVLEEHLVEFVVVVLAGVDQGVLAIAVEAVDHARQPDDLRPRADDGHDPEPSHRRHRG